MLWHGTLPLLLGGLIIPAMGLMFYGLFKVHRDAARGMPMGLRSDMILVGFVLLALFASGIFLTVLLVTIAKPGG